MKLKRLLLVSLLASSMLLGACGRRKPATPSESESTPETSESTPKTSESTPATSEEESTPIDTESVPAGTTVDTYLVLSAIGLYKGQKGQSYGAPYYLENAVKYTAKVGDPLPGKADVTTIPSSTGEFVSWVKYEGTGAPVKYEVVPAQKNTILYAYFSDTGEATSEQESQGGETSEDLGDYTYTVTSMPTWVKDNGCIIFAWVWSKTDNGSWKSLTYTSDTSATFDVTGELDGFLLARCVAGTTQPDWSIKSGDGVGRIYNKTADITCQSGVYSYACSNWVEYNG